MVGSTATRRYSDLVRDLGEERGLQRGWMTDVAKVLGVHKSYVSAIYQNPRGAVGVSVIHRAAAALGISPKHFFEETESTPLEAVAAKRATNDCAKRKAAPMAKQGQKPANSNQIQIALRANERALLDAEVSRRRDALMLIAGVGADDAARGVTRSGVIGALIREALDGTKGKASQ